MDGDRSARQGGVVARRLEGILGALLREEPVIVLNGARTVGKSTLLAAMGEEVHRRVLDLDDLATRDAVAADPALFTAEPPPVLVECC